MKLEMHRAFRSCATLSRSWPTVEGRPRHNFIAPEPAVRESRGLGHGRDFLAQLRNALPVYFVHRL
jgi:hypothetical protein